uniref:Uncharacterized protein n=1 Tax=Arundo donax TaxID=35708 RepID=A0A0A9EXY1_ARUDO
MGRPLLPRSRRGRGRGRMGLLLVHRPHQGPFRRVLALRRPPSPLPVRARIP